MSPQHINLKIPLSFKQVVDIVRQLSPSEKQQLTEVLWREQNIDDIVIPEEHKQIVRERIKKYENSNQNATPFCPPARLLRARK